MRKEVIGLATVYQADCREILPTLPKAQAVITDPPYGININASNRLSRERGFGDETWDKEAPPKETIDALLAAADKTIVWGGNYFHLPPTRCFLIWDKLNEGRDFADIEMAWTNFDAVARIFRLRPMNMDGGKVHPTQKPVALMKWCIEKAGFPELVIDPMMGSGSTGCAQVQLGKPFIGIELRPEAFDTACQRLEDVQRQQRMFG